MAERPSGGFLGLAKPQGTGAGVYKPPGSGVTAPAPWTAPFSGSTQAKPTGTGVRTNATPKRSAAPAPAPRSSGGRSGGFSAPFSGGPVGTSSTGQAAAMSAPAAPQPMSDADWWNQDADFQVEQSGLKNVLDTALANLALKRSTFDTDFVTTMKNLGWDWGGDETGSLDDLGAGKWDPTNKLSAYGSGFQNLNNDFASRGMVDSSFFGDAVTNFNTDFNNQFNQLRGQRDQFRQGLTGDETAAQNEYQNALARARAQSLARRDIAI